LKRANVEGTQQLGEIKRPQQKAVVKGEKKRKRHDKVKKSLNGKKIPKGTTVGVT